MSRVLPLIRLERFEEARERLRAAKDVFEREHNVSGLALVFSALADLENELGHDVPALQLEKHGIRYEYVSGKPDNIAISHFNLAFYLRRVDADPRKVLAHHLAAGVIRVHLGLSDRGEAVAAVGRDLELLADDTRVPTSFSEVCDIVGRIEGVDLRALIDRLSANPDDGDAALKSVLRSARTGRNVGVKAHLGAWEPVIAGVVAASRGDKQAVAVVLELLAPAAAGGRWAALARALLRIAAGEREGASLGDHDAFAAASAPLDSMGSAIVERTLKILAGELQLESPQLWKGLRGWQTPS